MLSEFNIFLLIYVSLVPLLKYTLYMIDKTDNLLIYIPLTIVSTLGFLAVYTYQSYYFIERNDSFIYLVLAIGALGLFEINKMRKEKKDENAD